jgi:hypothetical protein
MIHQIIPSRKYSVLLILQLQLQLQLLLLVLIATTQRRQNPAYNDTHPSSTNILGVVQGWTPTIIIGGNSRTTSRTTMTRRRRGRSTTTPRTTNKLSSSSSSYEEQYAQFSSNNNEEKEKPQEFEQQPSVLLSSPPTTTLFISNSNNNNNSNNKSNKISREDREIAFLQFISTGRTPQQSNAVPPISYQQQQQQLYPQLDDTISTSLEFSAFNNDNSNNNNAAAAANVYGDGNNNNNNNDATATAIDSTNNRDNIATTGGSSFSSVSSYLDSLSGNNNNQNNNNNINNNSNNNNEEIIAVEEASIIRPDTTTAAQNYEMNNEEVQDIIYAYNDAAAVAAMIGPDPTTIDEISTSTIEVQVKTTFPSGITVERAKSAWFDFCWTKGGGIIITTADKNDDSTLRYSSTSRKSAERGDDNYIVVDDDDNDGGGRVIPRVRKLMIPFGMKQEIISMTSSSTTKTAIPSSSSSSLLDVTTTIIGHTDNNSNGDGDVNDKEVILRRDSVSYRTIQRGIFCQDFLKDSHGGTVEFIETLSLPKSDLSSSVSSSSIDDLAVTQQTQMVWTVQFQIVVKQQQRDNNNNNNNNNNDNNNTQNNTRTLKENFWAYWSQFQLKTASQNLLAYLDTSTNPVFIEHIESMPIGISPREAMEKWHDYYWCRGGGGFPTLFVPPILLQSNKIRWIVPSGLEEEMISMEYSNDSNSSTEKNTEEMSEAIYRVNNPNLLTYPVHYHRAKVRFVRNTSDEPTQLIWNIEVQPYRKSLGRGVQFWTKSCIRSASQNLRRYLEEDEEELQPQQKQQKAVGGYSEAQRDRI